jgi:hypothetical protein
VIDLREEFENAFDLVSINSEFVLNETNESDLQLEKHDK